MTLLWGEGGVEEGRGCSDTATPGPGGTGIDTGAATVAAETSAAFLRGLPGGGGDVGVSASSVSEAVGLESEAVLLKKWVPVELDEACNSSGGLGACERKGGEGV